MKGILTSLLIFCTAYTASAQQTNKVDDALLMEYYQGQRYVEAADYLKKNFPEPVTDLKVLSRLAYASQMANKLPEAEGYYQRAYSMDTTNQNMLFNMAGINVRRGNMAKAEQYYKTIILKDTANIAVYAHLGSIAEGRHDTVNAILYFDKANKLNPFDTDVASELGDYYTSLQRYDEALKVLSKAAESDPENVVVLFSMMKLSYGEKKWNETVEACKKLVNLGFTNGELLNKLGIAYYNLKNYACGAETFASLHGTEQTEYTFYYAALCYKGLNDQKRCIYFFNQSIFQGISPNISTYYGEIAASDEKLGRHKKAALAYQKALQFSESPILYYLLANLYDTKLKDKRNARIYYKKYLASSPPERQQTYIAFVKSRMEQLKN